MLFLLAIMLSFAVYVLLKQRSQRQRPTPKPGSPESQGSVCGIVPSRLVSS
jgi:hypothetical protein